MADTRTRIRERRKDRRDARLAREHREAERMDGLALGRVGQGSAPSPLGGAPGQLSRYLGGRRAYQLTVAVFVLCLLVWLLT